MLLLLCLAVYVPGLGAIPPVDRDESRFAQASRQMFEAAAWPPERLDAARHAGGWVVPMVQDRPRLNKPPLIYWLQAASAWVLTGGDPLRDSIAFYRVPSVLAALAAVLLTWRLGLGMFDPRAAWLGAALLAVSPMVVWDAHQARADQLLLATVVLTQLALWRVINPRGHAPGFRLRWGMPALFWLGMTAGILTKGPITPAIALLTIVAWSLATRRWRWTLRLRWELGVPLAAACVGAWVWAAAGTVGGVGAWWEIVYRETVVRAAGRGDGAQHALPPGLHALAAAALLWPASIMAIEGLVRAARVGWPPGAARRWWNILGRRAGRPAELFLLCWLAPMWIVLECVLSKLPHYTMPLYPALALLCARAAYGRGARAGLLSLPGRAGVVAWTLVGGGAAVGAGLFAGPSLRPAAGADLAPWIAGAAALLAAIVLVGLAAASLWRGLAARGLLFGVAGGATTLLGAVLFVAPEVAPGRISADISAVLRTHDPAGVRPLASAYHEDSMVFHSRGRVLRLPAEKIDEWMATQESGLAVTDLPGRARAEALGWRTLGGPWRAKPAQRDGGHELWVVGREAERTP